MTPRTPVVLCAVDGGPATVAVLRRGAALAARLGSSLAVVHVARRVPSLAPELTAVELGQDAAVALFPVVVEALVDATVPWTLHARDGAPAHEIAQLADELRAEFVLLGTPRPAPWWRRRHLVDALTARLDRPVVVVSNDDAESPKVDQAV